jgi:hypothetical protein
MITNGQILEVKRCELLLVHSFQKLFMAFIAYFVRLLKLFGLPLVSFAFLSAFAF